MSLLSSARLAVRKVGLDVRRYPAADPLWPVAQLFESQSVDVVLDVGANDGGYGQAIRRLGYQRRLWSFEPLQQPFQRLRETTASDPLWESMRWAIGGSDGTATINVAGNNGASSSILPMLDRHKVSAPSSAYVGTEEVPMKRLDGLVQKLGVSPEDRLFLKIDVQGYEAAVLDGADALLSGGQVVGLQLELSFVPLYEGGMTWQEGFERAANLGMDLMALVPGFSEPSGRMLQADAVFFRPR